jgi:hypothetical protein
MIEYIYYPESRVPVINLEDGSRLSGDEAPQKKDLEKWLDEHPGFMVADCDDEDLYDVSCHRNLILLLILNVK